MASLSDASLRPAGPWPSSPVRFIRFVPVTPHLGHSTLPHLGPLHSLLPLSGKGLLHVFAWLAPPHSPGLCSDVTSARQLLLVTQANAVPPLSFRALTAAWFRP